MPSAPRNPRSFNPTKVLLKRRPRQRSTRRRRPFNPTKVLLKPRSPGTHAPDRLPFNPTKVLLKQLTSYSIGWTTRFNPTRVLLKHNQAQALINEFGMLQPHKGPAETRTGDGTLELRNELQPHKGPAETGRLSCARSSPSFNPTRVLLKPGWRGPDGRVRPGFNPTRVLLKPWPISGHMALSRGILHQGFRRPAIVYSPPGGRRTSRTIWRSPHHTTSSIQSAPDRRSTHLPTTTHPLHCHSLS